MPVTVSTREAKAILTVQRGGFAATGPYPFIHTLSPYTGCAFGATTCGLYCYAQFMPNWTFHNNGAEWGSAIGVKINAAEVLDETLRKMSAEKRRNLRIFMASATDPYQPVELEYGITRQCLQVFARYDDLELLVVQTRSPLVQRDFALIRQILYSWLSVTIETNDEALLKQLKGGPAIQKRFALIKQAHEQGIKAQIAVSPCMPYTPAFAPMLLSTGADRYIVDTFVEGDGSRGKRTERSVYATIMRDWRDTGQAHALFEQLQAAGVEVGWSAEGFCSIAPRKRNEQVYDMFSLLGEPQSA